MAVLFNFTRNMDADKSFIIAASVLLGLGLIMTSLVTEHTSSKLARRRAEEESARSFDRSTISGNSE